MELCESCNEKPKATKLSKYCEECKKKERLKSTIASKKRKTSGIKRMCYECNEVRVTTKYCAKCRKKVYAKQNRERNKKNRETIKKKIKVFKDKEFKKSGIYKDFHVGDITKEEMYNFEYSRVLREYLAEAKSRLKNDYKNKEKDGERISGVEKLLRKKAINKIRRNLEIMSKGNEKERAYAKMLNVQRQYLIAYEKEMLKLLIESKSKGNYGGSYTLAEAGDILGVTRERSRQIESGALKVLKHPQVARLLKDITFE